MAVFNQAIKMNGNAKNKELTKRKLIQAVGEVLKEEGYTGLGVNRIARQAGVSKKLIYRYFGTLDYLIESYIAENDYWLKFSIKLQDAIDGNVPEDLRHFIATVLDDQFDYFLSEREMQRLILWEISASSPLMRSIHNVRESTGQVLLEMTDGHFRSLAVNFRAVAALLVGGIYYTVLHIQSNGGKFCDLDLSDAQGQAEIRKAIRQIVGWAFQEEQSQPKPIL